MQEDVRKNIEEVKSETLNFSTEKVSKLLEETIEILQKHKPTVGELIIYFGNLGYSIGASMEGYEIKGQGDIEELRRKYYQEPSAGVGLMISGIQITGWYDKYSELYLKQQGAKK